MKDLKNEEEPAQKKNTPYKLEGSEEVGVDDFLSNIASERKKRVVDEEYQEDEVLSIVNHKNKWKKTWSKKQQRLERRQKFYSKKMSL
ncbi:unnamed protein product [Blepharisma stoltei]|uniref:Uncharacterized protein n=1 Tax=Blepharisma stoltei TaxID=1481888 RepID=A0AAU9ISC1_9CILI|nr:unnamed protein product [Blepharisma stoltei]